ncbi:MAG: SPOR domain-containing protein [bacterium]|nr:hypothetical protein [Deltaproteobacteria bacterium]MCP4907073.1 SPOR domain-containing protein [bacterium]
MAAPRGRGLRPGGVVRALGQLLVLVTIGFGVGLLFGIVTEEPELLAGHLRGESRSVALESGEFSLESDGMSAPVAPPSRSLVPTAELIASAPLPPVAAPRTLERSIPRAAGVDTTNIPVARVTGVPESARRAARATPGWSIQVGAFSERAAATRLAEGLRERYPVEILPASTKGSRWRVRIQPVPSEARALEMAESLKRDDRLPTWVTPMEGHSGS